MSFAPQGGKRPPPPPELAKLMRQLAEHEHEEHEEHVEHNEGWLVAYADMMTLLFGFFVLLFSMSTLNKNKFDSMRQSASETFGGQYQVPTEPLKREVTKAAAEALKADGKALGDKIEIKQDGEGLEIKLKGTSIFASASAELSAEAKQFVFQLSKALKKTGDDYVIRVEGHTDDAAINTPVFPSNWELSSARASAVIRYLIDNGISQTKVEAIGYGPSRPLKPNRTKDGKPIDENMSANRRIVVKIRKLLPQELKDLAALPVSPVRPVAAPGASPTAAEPAVSGSSPNREPASAPSAPATGVTPPSSAPQAQAQPQQTTSLARGGPVPASSIPPSAMIPARGAKAATSQAK